ncbi:hypothetical protein F5B21DRAFT_507944 [Xylaria acuta]|nr:hypothetical protein F5B21DRAFT_507944 [Xylaria acuta]
MLRYNANAAPQQGNPRNEQHRNLNFGPIADAAQPPQSQVRAEVAQLHRLQPQANRGSFSFHSTRTALGLVICAVCNEEYPIKDLCGLSCSHWHCKNCFTGNVHVALKSKPFVPAKCCGVIPIELLQQFGALTANEVEQYKVKMEELTNPRGKLYCWGCATYIPNDRRTKRIGDCGVCGKRTCKVCRAKSHFGVCDKTRIQADKDAEDHVYLLAESKGWKRCPNCLNLVQKNGGCDHMTNSNCSNDSNDSNCSNDSNDSNCSNNKCGNSNDRNYYSKYYSSRNYGSNKKTIVPVSMIVSYHQKWSLELAVRLLRLKGTTIYLEFYVHLDFEAWIYLLIKNMW